MPGRWAFLRGNCGYLWGIRQEDSRSVSRTSHSIFGLCGLATGVAARRGVSNSQLAYWKKQLAKFRLSIFRPTVPGRHNRVSGEPEYRQLYRVSDRCINGLEQPRDVTPFMTLLAAFQTAPPSLLRARRNRRWRADRKPEPERDRIIDRLFRQYVGVAHRSVRESAFQRAAPASARSMSRRLCASGCAIRENG